ncbi:hypothetical protein IMY96_23805, partial [Pimelobacter simplex]|nr:hypothetical protein [Pimelobacter simplex]
MAVEEGNRGRDRALVAGAVGLALAVLLAWLLLRGGAEPSPPVAEPPAPTSTPAP